MDTVRRAVNLVIVPVALALVLPTIAIAERLRRGSGRRVARHGIAAAARLCGIRFSVSGRALAGDTRCVFVANHSSLVDVPAMLMACDDVRFVAGADLYSSRLLAMAMRALGTLPIDRHRRAAVRDQLASVAAAASADRSSLVVFAEGAIAPAGSHLPFKSGAFALALELGVPVVPVAITGSADVLPPGGRLAVRPGTVHVDVLAPIPTAGLGPRDRIRLRARTEAAVRDALAAGGAR